MNNTAEISAISTATRTRYGRTHRGPTADGSDAAITRALELFHDAGFAFTAVQRCPGECTFCGQPAQQAA